MLKREGSDLVVLFGAAVRPDGRASPALRRRVDRARAAALADPAARIFCSGAEGRFGQAEALIMARMLSGSVGAGRLILDTESRDTLDTVLVAARLLRAEGRRSCVACTDDFHWPRVAMLFALRGIRATRAPDVPRLHRRAFRDRWRMRLREAAAIPYDLLAIAGRRISGRGWK